MHPDRIKNRTRANPGLYWVALACLLHSCTASSSRSLAVPFVRDPTELIHRIIADSNTLKDARIRARVSIEIDGVRQKASSVSFYRQPDDLRMEVSGTLGVSIMSTRFWADSLRIYLPGENGYIEGPAASVLYQVTGVDLSYYDVPNVLLGIPTLSPSDRERVIGFQTAPSYYILDLQYEHWKRKVWINRANLTVAREEIIDAYGERRSELRLADHRVVSGCWLPRRINISHGLNLIEFHVKSQKVNSGLPDNLFVQKMPPGVKRLDTEYNKSRQDNRRQ